MHTCSHDANSLVFPVHKADTGDLLSDLLLLLPWALTGGRPAVSLLAAGSSDPPSSLNSLITQKLFWTCLWLIWQRHVQMILWKWEEHLHVCKLIPATEAVLNEADASCSVYLVLSSFFPSLSPHPQQLTWLPLPEPGFCLIFTFILWGLYLTAQ